MHNITISGTQVSMGISSTSSLHIKTAKGAPSPSVGVSPASCKVWMNLSSLNELCFSNHSAFPMWGTSLREGAGQALCACHTAGVAALVPLDGSSPPMCSPHRKMSSWRAGVCPSHPGSRSQPKARSVQGEGWGAVSPTLSR